MKSTQLVTKYPSLKEGRIISTFIADDLRLYEKKTFEFEFLTKADFEEFSKDIQTYPNIEVVALNRRKNQAIVRFHDAEFNPFITLISKYGLKFFSEIKFTLEDYFLKFYDRNSGVEGGTA